MLLITCPATRTDELVADRRIRSIANHPTHLALSVECPSCGSVHVYRTGRRWERSRAAGAAAAAPAVAPAVVAPAVAAPAAVARPAVTPAAASSARPAAEPALT